MNRNLDGIFFRIERDGKWGSICFSDLTPEEREGVELTAEGWKWLACYMADLVKEIGDKFDIRGEY